MSISTRSLIPFPCKTCKKQFLWCWKNRNDFRCSNCRKGISVEAVEEEIAGMSKEEYQSFVEDIAEYENEYGTIKYEEENEQ